ncbi:MAG TPA: FHA domain-containing protein [Candidatus Nanopelagicales bacterium]|nr:FHA domain-containing protein [Candidatus Nanopelagicales bacterium]
MTFRLRYLAHDFELPEGVFLIGRSGECQLSLDDPLVSRKHAALHVRGDGVMVQDLESRNGVYVNGTRINSQRDVSDGDRITIGSQEMLLYGGEELRPDGMGIDFRRATQTLGAMALNEMRKIADEPTEFGGGGDGGSKGFQSLKLLTNLADKALGLGRHDEAERILQTILFDILNRARSNVPIEMPAAELATRYAARLAGATGKSSWVNYIFELYTLAQRPLPAPVIDELYVVVRKVKAPDLGPLRAYLDELHRLAPSFGPAEKFLVQRIEGLGRLVALQ